MIIANFYLYFSQRQPLFNVRHTCNRNQRSNVSVNSVKFHPIPGVGIIYGTNRGHIQHCHFIG